MDLINCDDNNQKNRIDYEKIVSKIVRKRLTRECENLYLTYPNLSLNVISGKTELTITDNFINKKHKYKLVFKETYPFKPPDIYYNDETYLELLKLKNKEEKDIVKKLKNKDCLCCDSFYCNDNWSPSITLKSIVDEIREIVLFKKTINEIIIANKIKAKYLIDDIDINSYLI